MSDEAHQSQTGRPLMPQRRGIRRWGAALLCVCAVQFAAALAGRLPVDDLTRHTRVLGIALVAAMMFGGFAARPTRQWAVVLGAAALLLLAARWIGPTARLLSFPAEKRLPRSAAVAIGVVCLAAWVGEYWDNPDEQSEVRHTLWLGIYLPFAAALGAIVVVSIDYQLLGQLDFYVPFGNGAIQIADIIFPGLVAFCAWCAADAALEASRRSVGARAMHVGIAALLVIVAPIWWTVRPSLAARALVNIRQGGSAGVILPYRAAEVLANHGDASDVDLIWELVAAVDATNGPRDLIEPLSWRPYLINLMAKRDRADTAARLSHIFRNRPTPGMAADAAAVLADEHRYEAAPLLLRYALWSWPDDPALERRCAAALEQMRVPETAAVILRDSGSAGALEAMPAEEVRFRLSNVLGKVGGRDNAPPAERADQLVWLHKQFAAAPVSMPGPLTPGQRAEADATVDAMYLYWAARDRAEIAGVSVREQIDFDSPDTGVLTAQVKDYAERVDTAVSGTGGAGSGR
jgi:hypothetical protein